MAQRGRGTIQRCFHDTLSPFQIHTMDSPGLLLLPLLSLGVTRAPAAPTTSLAASLGSSTRTAGYADNSGPVWSSLQVSNYCRLPGGALIQHGAAEKPHHRRTHL